MKGDKMKLLAQLLLESRTCAYIEWLANELILNANKNIHKDADRTLTNVKSL